MSIDWSLLKVPDIGKAAMQGYEEGKKRRALEAFAQNQNDPNTLNALIATNPELGFKAAEYRAKMQDQQREADTRNALADYVTSQMTQPSRNALAPSAPYQPVGGGQTRMPGGRTGMPSPSPVVQGATTMETRPPQQQSAPGQIDWSIVGQPQTPADHKFMRLVRLDPKAALQIDSGLRDNMVKRLTAEHDIFDFAVAGLAGAQDEASYQALVAAADQRSIALGLGSIRDNVPANYPGPDGIEQLRLRALTTKEQIASLLQRDNMEADNARADRNTDSIISDRSARFGETQRFHNATIATRQRGQDISASTSRRGQDIGAATARRGQDIRGAGGAIRTVSSPTDALKLPSGTRFRTPDGTVRVRP